MKKKLLLATFSLLGTVLICEAALRLVGYHYTPLTIEDADSTNDWRRCHAFADHNFIYDPLLLWRPDPACPAFDRHGFIRGRDLPEVKRKDEFRIFAVGDSNTAGWYDDGLADFRDAPWPSYLREMVAEHNAGCSVTNSGVWGYSSYQGLARLRECLAFEPDLVLVSFGSNDAQRVGISDARFTPRLFRSPLSRTRLGELAIAAWYGPTTGATATERLVPRVSVREYRDNLAEMIRLCRENRVECVLLTRPFTGESPDALWWKSFAPDYVEATIEVGRENDARVIDVFEHFKGREECFRDECHFTEEGHRAAAELIYRRIESFLPARDRQ